MTEKLIGFSIFNQVEGDYLAKFLDKDGLILRGFGTVDIALVYPTIEKAKQILVDCNSQCIVVRLYKNKGALIHKTIT